MNLPTIEMKECDAYQLLKEYRDVPESRRTPGDAITATGYEALARGETVIDLFAAMHDAGLDREGMPRLAIARADRRAVVFEAETRDGSGRFECVPEGFSGRATPISLQVRLPAGCWSFPPDRNIRSWNRRAYVPIIPPRHRPATYMLKRLYLLWDAVWTPAPPADPFLLRPLGGMLYAVVAQWDLTELERAVLRGRILADR